LLGVEDGLDDNPAMSPPPEHDGDEDDMESPNPAPVPSGVSDRIVSESTIEVCSSGPRADDTTDPGPVPNGVSDRIVSESTIDVSPSATRTDGPNNEPCKPLDTSRVLGPRFPRPPSGLDIEDDIADDSCEK